MSAFPTGVAVVTAVGPAGRLHGLTCTSLASVTLTPPTLLVCLNVRSGTCAAVRYGGQFAVNLLRSRAQRVAELFASPRALDRFSHVPWRLGPRTGLPWLHEDAFALAECHVAASTAVGDHAVVLGEVVHIEQEPGTPLLYGLRQFASFPAERLQAVPG